jgi:ATP-dependent Lhr-like helicase
VPVPDLGCQIGSAHGDLSGPAAGDQARASIWPHVEERIVDLVAAHRSTLVFANSRRLAERLTTRLNEIWQERTEESLDNARRQLAAGSAGTPPAGTGLGAHGIPAGAAWGGAAGGMPAQIMAQSGAAEGRRRCSPGPTTDR